MSRNTSTYINLLTDFGFKHIFGRNADKEFVMSFLNALIGGSIPITDVTFFDKEHNGDTENDRALIYDLHCELKDGRKIIVEIQNRYQTHYDDRALYYLASDLYAQGHKEHWDYDLTPVYGVFLMNFEWKDFEEQYMREDVSLYNMQTRKVFSDRLRMTFLRIPMFHKQADDCKTTLDRWLYLLKNMEKMESMPTMFVQDPVFRKLAQATQYANLSEKDKEAYRKSLKAYMNDYAIYQTERAEGRALGLAQGIAQGMAEGRAKGRAEGRAEGKAEGRSEERKAGFRTMLSFGITAEQIAMKYGITAEEVRRIVNSN